MNGRKNLINANSMYDPSFLELEGPYIKVFITGHIS
jgi:hypothetical protein